MVLSVAHYGAEVTVEVSPPRRFIKNHLTSRELPGELRLVRFIFVVLAAPFLILAIPVVLYSFRSGIPTVDEWKYVALTLGGLTWFSVPLVWLPRFTAFGYWWAVFTVGAPCLGGLSLAVYTFGEDMGCGAVLLLLVVLFLLVPCVLLLRARSAYFTRLRLLEEARK